MRVFIAIPFSGKNKEELGKIQNVIRKKSTGGRFAESDNFHLTIKFIGELDEEKLEELKRALRNVAKENTSFSILLEGFGTFQKGRTHIPWFGVTMGKDPVEKLQEKVETALEERGYKKESRPFQPHMTFGRKVQLSSSDTLYLQETLKIHKVLVEVESLALMDSTRIDGKLVYPVLEEFPLLHQSEPDGTSHD